MKKIRVIINGGLGNQLFQYAFYLYLLQEYPMASIKLDFFQYKYEAHHQGIEIHKIFKCDCMNIINQIEMFRKQKSRNKFYLNLIHTIKYKLLRYKTFYDVSLNTHNKVSQIINNYDRIIFAGFFQCPHFVSAVETRLRDIINRNQILGQRNDNLLNSLNGKISVSVHIRRGDYLSISVYNTFDPITYYNKAMDFFLNRFKDIVFVFFSNDINWVKENLCIDREAVYVDWNVGEDSFKDLIIMSQCTHNIIANSTFSWWGAWLNNNPNKIVISPKQWMRHKPSADVVPQSWILI